MYFVSKEMSEKKVEVTISGFDKLEQENLARKIRETIQKENRLRNKTESEKITYQINF